MAKQDLVLADRYVQVCQRRFSNKPRVNEHFGPWLRVDTDAARRDRHVHVGDLSGAERHRAAKIDAQRGVDQVQLMRASRRDDRPVGRRTQHAFALQDLQFDRRDDSHTTGALAAGRLSDRVRGTRFWLGRLRDWNERGSQCRRISSRRRFRRGSWRRGGRRYNLRWLPHQQCGNHPCFNEHNGPEGSRDPW